MSLIIRTWGCHNRACLSVFDSGDRAPACPKCGCIRVGWVPGRVNIGSERTRNSDSTLRMLAEAYGLSDLASAREGEPAKKMAPARGGNAGVMNFQGFAANVDPQGAVTQNNQSGAQCVPTSNRFDVKVRPGMDSRLSGQAGFGSIAANTQVVASDRGGR